MPLKPHKSSTGAVLLKIIGCLPRTVCCCLFCCVSMFSCNKKEKIEFSQASDDCAPSFCRESKRSRVAKNVFYSIFITDVGSERSDEQNKFLSLPVEDSQEILKHYLLRTLIKLFEKYDLNDILARKLTDYEQRRIASKLLAAITSHEQFPTLDQFKEGLKQANIAPTDKAQVNAFFSGILNSICTFNYIKNTLDQISDEIHASRVYRLAQEKAEIEANKLRQSQAAEQRALQQKQQFQNKLFAFNAGKNFNTQNQIPIQHVNQL